MSILVQLLACVQQWVTQRLYYIYVLFFRTHKRKLAENEEGTRRKKSKKGVSRKAGSKPTKLMKQRAKKRKR